jgi:mannose-6-phosphate isomerase-like protein (cupin superfamily)
MDYAVYCQNALPTINGVPSWEGQRIGDATISILFVEAPPGKGPRLHSHPYQEVFLIHAGEARFTIGQTSVDLAAGQLVVVAAGVPHKFVNEGKGILWQTDIHLSALIETTWLED